MPAFRLVALLSSAFMINFLPPPVEAGAQPGAAASRASFWRQASEEDVEAAYALVHDNHPAALPEVGDDAFRLALEEAHARARQRAREVVDYAGYAATLSAFAIALGDRHLRARPKLVVARPEWPGFVMGRRGTRWRVVDAENEHDELKGAELLRCDGVDVDELARRTIGVFRVDWRIEAQRTKAAPWLLVDEGNPFVPRPQRCTFDVNGRHREITLDWRPIRRESLLPRIEQAIGTGAAGFGMRNVGDGVWIGLQGLGDAARPVVDAVQSRAAALRQAQFVVLDLRGNGGGSSLFGREIAEALMGSEYVAAVLGSGESNCASVWRVTPDNIATLHFYREELAPTRGPALVKIVDALLERASAAEAAGRHFTSSLDCAAPEPVAAARRPASLMQGRMVILTDAACFSSCLIVVRDFRQLGALHLGQATDANTRYTEVRDEPLPSGLATFSTMQAFSPADPVRMGPFEPAQRYDGDIADTAVVERWVLEVIEADAASR